MVKKEKEKKEMANEGKKKLLVSFSGGESSAFMTQWLLKNKQDEFDMICIFANTGEENEETLEFIEKCDKYFGMNLIWVECITNPKYRQGIKAKVVNFETACRNGEPFEAMIAKHGIPNINFPHCSREMKQYTMMSYMRELGIKDYYTAIGYRSDEMDRMVKNWRGKKHIYPMIFKGFCQATKVDVNKFWRDMPFRLTIEGYEDNCKVCWKKSLRKLLTIAKNYPERFKNFKKWEEKYEYFIPDSRKETQNFKPPIRFFRGNLSVAEIMEMSKADFEEALDDRQKYIEYKQMELFGHELDTSNGCLEECKVWE